MKPKSKKKTMENQNMMLTKVAGVLVLCIIAGLFFLRSDTGRELVNLPLDGVNSEAAGAKIKRAAHGIPEEYIVVLKDSVDVDEAATSLSRRYNAQVKHVYKTALKGFSAKIPDALLEQMATESSIDYIEQDATAELSDVQTGATWGLDRIDQRNLPINGNYNYTGSGTGVHAYVIDTGIRATHQDFGGRVELSFDAVGDGQNGNDCHGHGTHVAGTIGSNTYGVAKNVTLHSVRVMDCAGSGTVSGIIAGLDWIGRSGQRPAVANMSIIVSGISDSLNRSMRSAISRGVTLVVAAGNFNSDACWYSPPAVTEAIVVGASDLYDNRASYSNYGSCVDVSAPGTGITSLANWDDVSIRGMSGTSMASPHVAGVAALFLGANRDASPALVESSILASATDGVLNGIPGGTVNNLVFNEVTSGGSTPPPSPEPPSNDCNGTYYTGSIAAGETQYLPSNGFSIRSRNPVTVVGNLIGQYAGQLRLALEKKVKKNWEQVAISAGGGVTEQLTYYASKGSYRWKITATGTNSYSLCSVQL